MTELVIQLFARYPRPGEVKSRLIPAIGAQAACALQLAMLDDFVQKLAAVTALEVWGTESASLPHYQHLLTLGAHRFHRQLGSDLGQRMERAVASAHRRARIPLLVGGDCPQIDRQLVDKIDQQLRAGAQAVMVPATDGGYVALALRQRHYSLFRNIDWGSETVAAQTKAAFRRCRIDCVELDPQSDIDTCADLPVLETLNKQHNPAIFKWLELHRQLYQ